ncbi:MAG: hypothetical protein WCI55_16925 [Armatimonadota bacterium]
MNKLIAMETRQANPTKMFSFRFRIPARNAFTKNITASTMIVANRIAVRSSPFDRIMKGRAEANMRTILMTMKSSSLKNLHTAFVLFFKDISK